jgi:hypothetical protein
MPVEGGQSLPQLHGVEAVRQAAGLGGAIGGEHREQRPDHQKDAFFILAALAILCPRSRRRTPANIADQ